MTIQEHISNHGAKITRLQTNVKYQTRMLASHSTSTTHGFSISHPLARAEEVLTIGEEIRKLEIEIRISREIRSTLTNILAEG